MATKIGDRLNVRKISGKPGGLNHDIYLDCINNRFNWQGQIVYLFDTADPPSEHFPAAKKFYVNEEGFWYIYYLGYAPEAATDSSGGYTEEE